jgi:hypothetical protein
MPLSVGTNGKTRNEIQNASRESSTVIDNNIDEHIE